VTTTWTCRDGRVLKLSEMADRHLRHAHRMVIRHARLVLLAELGEIRRLPADAPEAAGQEIEARSEPFWARLEALTDELHRRKLEPLETL
jgi:hypothetical protein